MDIFGIGPTELVFIILVALILLGPKEMEKTGRTIGRFLRNLTRSEGWQAFRDTSREIRNLPTRLMREANLEDLQKDVGQIKGEIEEATDLSKEGFGTWSASANKRPEFKTPQSKPEPESVKESDKEPDKDA